MKLGSQSTHATVLERIERMCAINLLTLENENAGQPLDEFLPMERMSSYTVHIFPDTNSDGETVLSLAIDGEASYYHREDVRIIINFSCQHSVIRFTKLICIHQVVEFFRINGFSMTFSTSALRPMWLTTPGMNISVGFDLDVIIIVILFCEHTYRSR